MNKIAVAADLHLGRGGKKGITQYSRTFEEMISGMLSVKPKYAVFPGDLFHNVAAFSPETYDSVILDGLLGLVAAGTEVFLLPGNHDYEASGVGHALKPFARHDGIFVFDEISSMKDNEYGMVFIPWISKVGLKAKEVNTRLDAQDIVYEIHEKIVKPQVTELVQRPHFQSTPENLKTNICFFHASIIGGAPCATSASIVGTDFVLDPKFLESLGFAHVIGGHFHRRQEIGKHTAYVGSMERNDFGEKDYKTGFMVIDGGKKEWVELKKSQRFQVVSFEAESGFSYPELCKGFNVKVQPSMSRHDVLDRPGIEKQFLDAGAVSVVFDPHYTDEIQSRSADVSLELPEAELLGVWCEENPDKAQDGLIAELYEYERNSGFPGDDDFNLGKHVDSFSNGGE